MYEHVGCGVTCPLAAHTIRHATARFCSFVRPLEADETRMASIWMRVVLHFHASCHRNLTKCERYAYLISSVFVSCFCLFLIPDVFKTILEKSITCDYDAVCKLWIGPKLIVFLFNPADVELILSSHVFIDKSAEYRFFKPWLGDGLLISTGEPNV